MNCIRMCWIQRHYQQTNQELKYDGVHLRLGDTLARSSHRAPALAGNARLHRRALGETGER
jgi:hypothetical protein